MAESLAPAGAILALLALDLGVPVNADEFAETWLRDSDLVVDDAAAMPQITGKGRAWIALLRATPLPVKIERWGDPRGDAVIPAAPAPAFDAVALAAAVAQAVGAVIRPIATAAPSANRPASAPADGFEIPPGFNPNRYTDLPPGQLPNGLQRDWEIEVIWRDGHPRKMFAGSVIWKHTGKKDDVMAFRVIPGGDATTSPTIQIN